MQMSWASFQEFLTAEKSGRTYPPVIGVILISYIIAVTLLLYGVHEFWQSRTYLERHCRVDSIELESKSVLLTRSSREIRQGSQYQTMWTAIWYVTVIDEEDVQITNPHGRVVSMISTGSKSHQLRIANKKKVGEIYPFYRHRDTSLSEEHPWQWHKPRKLLAFVLLLPGIILFCVGSALFVLRQYYQHERQDTEWTKPLNVTGTLYNSTRKMYI